MKSIRIVFILSGVLTLAAMGVAVYLMFRGPEELRLPEKSLPELLESGELVPLIAIPFALIICALVIIPFIRILFPGEIKNGVTASARVLKVWDTGVSINDNPQVGLLLEVSPPGGLSFQEEAKTIVSRLNAALVQPGTTAEVKYDPEKPKRLRVLTIHTQGIASQDTSDRLEELNDLRAKGLITAEEYQKKRDEILKAL